MTKAAPSIGILTCSYRGDVDPCRLLCRTIDRFAPWVEHRLIVPKADLALFTPMRSARREVIAAEELQPAWLIGLPMPGPEWRRRLHLPRREVLLSLRGLPVRGWIAQQLRKIAAARASSWDVVLHLDSDAALFRDFTLDHLIRDGRVRFFRNPGAADLETHRPWHHAAARLFGLPDTSYFGADYIDPVVIWQKTHVRAMTDRIEDVAGRDWWTTLSRTLHFAEYILYGVYVDHVMTTDPGHFPTNQSLALSRWSGKFDGQADADAFLRSIRPDQVVCLMQSTIGLTQAEREQMLDQLITYAAGQEPGVETPLAVGPA